MDNPPNYIRLYEIAENQAGYFTSRQAEKVGFTWERLSANVSKGNFIRIQRAIYRLMQFPHSPYEDLFVAWLKTGSEAVISHDSALYLYNLSDILPSEVHVIMPRTGSRRRKGIRLHTNRLNPNEVTHREGLPVTITARTIIDVIVNGIGEEQVTKAIHTGIRQGLIDIGELRSMALKRGGNVLRIIDKILNSESQ